MAPQGQDAQMKNLSQSFDHLEVEESATAATELSDFLANGENSSAHLEGNIEICGTGITKQSKEDIPPEVSLQPSETNHRDSVRRPSILKKPQEEKDPSDSLSGAIKPKQTVSFDRIIVREYSMTLGDNPSCSYGPPVQLDWDYDESDSKDVDEFEETRSKERHTSLRGLNINYWDRCKIIQAAGHNESDIKSTERQVNQAKRQRNTTRFLLPVMKVEHVVKSAGRKMKRFVTKPEKNKIISVSEQHAIPLKH